MPQVFDIPIGMLTAVFAETMKQVGVQAPPMPGQQSSGYQNWQRSSGYWTGNEHHRRYHTHHHWKGRS